MYIAIHVLTIIFRGKRWEARVVALPSSSTASAGPFTALLEQREKILRITLSKFDPLANSLQLSPFPHEVRENHALFRSGAVYHDENIFVLMLLRLKSPSDTETTLLYFDKMQMRMVREVSLSQYLWLDSSQVLSSTKYLCMGTEGFMKLWDTVANTVAPALEWNSWNSVSEKKAFVSSAQCKYFLSHRYDRMPGMVSISP